jgi:putative ribosome biogenesis GTPase RsgA
MSGGLHAAKAGNAPHTSVSLAPATLSTHYEPAVTTSTLPQENKKPASQTKSYVDSWRIALLGDGGVGKTALAIQVREIDMPTFHY